MTSFEVQEKSIGTAWVIDTNIVLDLWLFEDPDDQKFIDLAVAHAVPLLSKDNAILCMRKRLLQSGVVLNPTDIPAN